MTRDKSVSNRKRVIMELSWRKGQGVNDDVENNTYLGTQFQIHYPSVDDIIHKLNTLGPDIKIFKVDTSRAFRPICIDPEDIDLLDLHQYHNIFVDFAIRFQIRIFFFQKLSDGVRYIMNKWS